MVGVLQETPSGLQANPRLSSLATGDTRVAGKCGALSPTSTGRGSCSRPASLDVETSR